MHPLFFKLNPMKHLYEILWATGNSSKMCVEGSIEDYLAKEFDTDYETVFRLVSDITDRGEAYTKDEAIKLAKELFELCEVSYTEDLLKNLFLSPFVPVTYYHQITYEYMFSDSLISLT